MADMIQVDVDFPETSTTVDGVEVQYPAYKDAIYLTFQEYSALTPEQLDTLRLDRYNGWKAHLDAARNAPAVEVAPADENDTLLNLQQQAQDMLDQINAQIAARTQTPAEQPALEA